MRRELSGSRPWHGRPTIDLLRDNPRTRRLLPAAAAAVIAVGVGQLADLITFTSMVRVHGLDAEANPLARAALEMGMPTVIALKVLLILLVLALFVADSPRHPRTAAMIVTIATMAGLLGAASNIATLQA
jgi:hypothetical protein